MPLTRSGKHIDDLVALTVRMRIVYDYPNQSHGCSSLFSHSHLTNLPSSRHISSYFANQSIVFGSRIAGKPLTLLDLRPLGKFLFGVRPLFSPLPVDPTTVNPKCSATIPCPPTHPPSTSPIQGSFLPSISSDAPHLTPNLTLHPLTLSPFLLPRPEFTESTVSHFVSARSK
ncbi:hypothetical protein H2248_003222 [Termitomyces sp. 'cryptogamus']|nr:hypothetical protein H2248_003222 [Termitomyces sp. 'cryptogamus']